jgi:Flp pilus assembly protein TadG
MSNTTFSRLRRRSAVRRGRGAALIEMAVVLVVLFYLVMGGVEFGWYMFSKHTVQAAARDAARAAIISNATHAQANAAITETMTSAGFGSGYTTQYQRVTAGPGGTLTYTTISDISSVPRGEGIRVTISAPFSAFRVRPLGVIPANKTVSGVTMMVKE